MKKQYGRISSSSHGRRIRSVVETRIAKVESEPFSTEQIDCVSPLAVLSFDTHCPRASSPRERLLSIPNISMIYHGCHFYGRVGGVTRPCPPRGRAGCGSGNPL